MPSANEHLHRLADELPADLASEVVDFAERLRLRHDGPPGAEGTAWLAAGLEDALAGLTEVEASTPRDQVAGWLHALDQGAMLVRWDEEHGEFVEIAG